MWSIFPSLQSPERDSIELVQYLPQEFDMRKVKVVLLGAVHVIGEVIHCTFPESQPLPLNAVAVLFTRKPKPFRSSPQLVQPTYSLLSLIH